MRVRSLSTLQLWFAVVVPVAVVLFIERIIAFAPEIATAAVCLGAIWLLSRSETWCCWMVEQWKLRDQPIVPVETDALRIAGMALKEAVPFSLCQPDAVHIAIQRGWVRREGKYLVKCTR